MASITDVARLAGVGVSTASRVLSGKGYTSERTREKVLAAVKKLNYVPNELAKNLLQNSSKTIAVIVPEIYHPFFSAFVNEIEISLRIRGYKTMLCCSLGQQSNESLYLSQLDQNLVDGVITCASLLDDRHYASIQRPVVSLDCELAPHIPMVTADNEAGGRAAAEMLLKAGCKHIVQMRDSVELGQKQYGSDLELGQFHYSLRYDTFREVVEAGGAKCSQYYVPCGILRGAASASYVEDCFHRFPDADGFMSTDTFALQYASVALRHGKRIPEELKIVAFDGTEVISVAYPPMSAVVQPVQSLAQTAVSLLMKRINNEPIAENRVILPVEIIDHMNDIR